MLGILFLFLTTGLWWLSDLILKPKRLTCEKVYKMEAAKGRFDEKAYQAVRKKAFTVASDYGYELSCELLEPDPLENSPDNAADGRKEKAKGKKLAILCHGFSHAKYECLIYAEIFLRMGFTVIIYDHRNHGLSGRAFTSMGYYEKFDLKKVVDWCYDTYGSDCRVVTMGESMGAATVLLHLGIDNRVKCAIADCSYSDLTQLIKDQLKRYYHLPSFLIPVESFITYLRAGFWYKDVSPIKAVRQTDTPILFIHGKKDCYVPEYMSKQMYACKKNNKAIYLAAGAGHAQSCLVNRKGYEKRIREYIKRSL